MKKLSPLLFLILLTSQAFAKCGPAAIWAFPMKKEIKQNSWILLEGYSMSQQVIQNLDKKYPVFLTAKGHKVKLLVQETNKGEFQVTQALLKPSEPLITGQEYVLQIENLPEYEKRSLTRWNPKSNKSEPISWLVEKGKDNHIPKLKTAPQLAGSKVKAFGCGPEVYAQFKFELVEKDEVWVKTEVVNISTGKRTTYLVPLSDTDTLSIGHGMCAGPFKFVRANKYKARFTHMDIAGNSTGKWTAWKEFDSPFKEFAYKE
ncbi:MAG: hypothetical protein ACO1OQ_12695 [Rufibacter sp.]